jgi:putative ABC transport system substrate-binding protein
MNKMMNKIKNTTTILLTICLLLSGCSKKTPTTAKAESNKSQKTVNSVTHYRPYGLTSTSRGSNPTVQHRLPAYSGNLSLGIAWAGKSGMTRRVVVGMEEVLEEYASQIRLEWHKELADLAALEAVAQRFQQEKDGMVILRSTGAKYLKNNPPSIPSFIGGCNDPTQIGVINNMQAPEGNVTGVTYALSYDVQFKTFLAIMPDITSVLLLVEKDHPGSEVDIAGTEKTCRKNGITFNKTICASKEDIVNSIKGYHGKVSAFILGNQALIFDNAGIIADAAGTTPTFAYTANPVKEGVLCGLSADDKKLGRMLGKSIIDVLVYKKPISQVPVKVDAEPILSVNMTTAKTIGIEIPIGILKIAKIFE